MRRKLLLYPALVALALSLFLAPIPPQTPLRSLEPRPQALALSGSEAIRIFAHRRMALPFRT